MWLREPAKYKKTNRDKAIFTLTTKKHIPLHNQRYLLQWLLSKTPSSSILSLRFTIPSKLFPISPSLFSLFLLTISSFSFFRSQKLHGRFVCCRAGVSFLVRAEQAHGSSINGHACSSEGQFLPSWHGKSGFTSIKVPVTLPFCLILWVNWMCMLFSNCLEYPLDFALVNWECWRFY